MDQFSAHLDRGWDLISRGDVQGAESSARRALELDAESPEAFNLLGYAAALQGEFDDAMENYQQAIALDDTYLEAILNAAELMIHPFADFEAADRLCEDALHLADSDEERVDVLLLKFDVFIGQGKRDEARQLCDRFPRASFENPAHSFLVGRALFETGSTDEALPLMQVAVQAQPDNADAFYYLGLIHDDRGETDLAIDAFLEARYYDIEMPDHGFSLSRETFRETAQSVFGALNAEMREQLAQTRVYYLDVPGAELVVDGVDPRAILLLESPPPDPESGVQSADRLYVYQRNLERVASNLEALKTELETALLRELGAPETAPLGGTVSDNQSH